MASGPVEELGERPGRKRTTKPAAERRRDLLDAAAKVFSERGFWAVGIADITEAAGVAIGTFYRYFDSKDQILVALRQRLVDEMVARSGDTLGELLGGGFDPAKWWSLIDGLIEGMIDFWFEDRALNRVVLGVTPEFGFGDTLEGERRMRQVVEMGIHLGAGAGLVEVTDPELLAILIINGVYGALFHAMIDDDPPSRDRIATAVKELVHKALARPA